MVTTLKSRELHSLKRNQLGRSNTKISESLDDKDTLFLTILQQPLWSAVRYGSNCATCYTRSLTDVTKSNSMGWDYIRYSCLHWQRRTRQPIDFISDMSGVPKVDLGGKSLSQLEILSKERNKQVLSYLNLIHSLKVASWMYQFPAFKDSSLDSNRGQYERMSADHKNNMIPIRYCSRQN